MPPHRDFTQVKPELNTPEEDTKKKRKKRISNSILFRDTELILSVDMF